MYNTIYDTVDNITLYVGESVRINCPSCKGYKTFTVSNMGGNIVWNCYKASCAVSGGKRVGMTPDDIKNMKARQIEKEIGCSKSTIAYHLGKGQKEKAYLRSKKSKKKRKQLELPLVA